MSVAFRRDSDEEHKEPRFALPIPPGPNLVTERGRALIAERLAALDAAIAADGGDEHVAGLKRDQAYWAARHASARLAPLADGAEAAFGTRVEFRQNGGPARSIAIVGQDEADPAAGLIAWDAPLARALIGAAGGDRVDFAGRPDAIEVIAIHPL
jgi:transcription elongation GreA/GreB family factor